MDSLASLDSVLNLVSVSTVLTHILDSISNLVYLTRLLFLFWIHSQLWLTHFNFYLTQIQFKLLVLKFSMYTIEIKIRNSLIVFIFYFDLSISFINRQEKREVIEMVVKNKKELI